LGWWVGKPHFGLRRQSEATTALFPRLTFSRKKSGVALRFPPHSKETRPYRLRRKVRAIRVIRG